MNKQEEIARLMEVQMLLIEQMMRGANELIVEYRKVQEKIERLKEE